MPRNTWMFVAIFLFVSAYQFFQIDTVDRMEIAVKITLRLMGFVILALLVSCVLDWPIKKVQLQSPLIMIPFVILLLLSIIFYQAQALIQTHRHNQQTINQLDQAKDTILIEGCVINLINGDYYTKILLSNISLYEDEKQVELIKRLDADDSLLQKPFPSRSYKAYVYQRLEDSDLLASRNRLPEIGDCALWRGNIKSISGVVNEVGFDYQKWALTKGLIASISAKNMVYKKAVKDRGFLSMVRDYKKNLFQYIQSFDNDSFSKSFLIALLLGDKSALDYDSKKDFQSMGISHVIAVSGLHIGTVFIWIVLIISFLIKCLRLFVYAITKLFDTRFTSFALFNKWLLILSRRLCIQWLSLFLVLFYAFLTGWQLPVQRAWLMFLLVMIGVSFHVRYKLIDIISMALILMIFSSPVVVIDASFQLSMSAMIIICLFLNNQQFKVKISEFVLFDKRRKLLTFNNNPILTYVLSYLSNYVSLQGWFYFLMLPASVFILSGVSLFSFFYNSITVLIVVLLIFPLGLMALILYLLDFVVIANYFLAASISITNIWWFLIKWIQESIGESLVFMIESDWVLGDMMNDVVHLLMNGSAFYSYIPMGYFAFFFLIVVTVYVFKQKRLLILLLIFFLWAFYFYPSNKPKLGEFTMQVFDVGQGLSILVETQNHHLLYDFGAASSSGFSYFNQVVLAALNAKRLRHLNATVISHNDNDHAGGFLDYERYRKNNFMNKDSWLLVPQLNLNFYHSMAAENSRQRILACENVTWQWDNVTFELIGLNRKIEDSSQNNNSCVLMVSSDSGRVLIPGDIEWQIEMMLALSDFVDIKSDILIAPHHGSATSSSSIFIDEVSPATVIYSSGLNNRYNHPSAEVFERYQKRGIQHYNTACHGQITIEFKNGQQKVMTIRELKNRLWYQDCPLLKAPITQ